MTINPSQLLGKTKKEILSIMKGDEFNYFHSDQWSYFVKKNWLGQQVYLYIYFEKDKVKKAGLSSCKKKK